MREIKFRVWNGTEFLFSEKETGGFWGDIVMDNFRLNNIQQQYTGLLDKNRKEIYEGDLIKRDGNNNDILVVVFFKGMFGWWDIDYNDALNGTEFTCINGWDPSKRLEIIGNIYENSELLEK